jgi:DNA-binding Lrp family transcriptional regulator
MLSELEKRVIASIQGDLPLSERPYLEIAHRLGISEDRLLDVLRDLCRRGVIRRFGATLRHQKSGFAANAMGAWKVPEDRVEEVGTRMAGSPHVSHCYRRDPGADWPYNLYTMIHGADRPGVEAVAADLSRQTGITAYRLLFSRHELKKTSMRYFPES